MTVIYFIRHGEFENPEKIVPWRLPGFPLSKKGIKDIEKVAEFFKNIKVGAEDLLDSKDYIPKAGILKLVFDRTKATSINNMISIF